jgi:enoyl-CoA hydratase
MAVVDFEKRGRVAWVTINRPERGNTLIAESFALLAEAWREIRADDAVRVAVLTATGTRDFCCGGDLVDYIPAGVGARKKPADEIERQKTSGPRQALMLDAPVLKPVIAAVNGRALGGGVELLEATDIRVASATATFGLPEPKVGIVPGAGSLVRLPRQLPYAHAMYMMLTAQPIDAETALRWGLISEVVAPEALLARAEELATLVARNAPLAMRAIKQTAYETYGAPWDAAHATEAKHVRTVLASRDAKEGPAAFAAKRPPDFIGG